MLRTEFIVAILCNKRPLAILTHPQGVLGICQSQ